METLGSCPVSFFLATAVPEQSKKFYKDVLALPLLEDTPFALVFKLNNAELRISKVPAITPFPWTVLDWQVASLAHSMKMLTDNHVNFERFESMGQNAQGIWTTPDQSTRIAWFKDPDGNLLSVSERS